MPRILLQGSNEIGSGRWTDKDGGGGGGCAVVHHDAESASIQPSNALGKKGAFQSRGIKTKRTLHQLMR